MYSVLYVDDEEGLLEVCKLYLERSGNFRIDTSISGREALDRIRAVSYDAVVSDYQMPGMDGIALLKEVRSAWRDLPFILFTGKGREEVVIEAINNGADFYLQKGGEPTAQFAELAHKILRAIEIKTARQEALEIIQGSPIPEFVIDRDHRVTFWNRALEEYSGIPAQAVVGSTDHWKAFYDHQRPCLADLIVDANIDGISRWYGGKQEKPSIIPGAYEAADFFPLIKGGTWLFFTAAPLRDPAGHIIGAIETLQDVTSLRKKEEELRSACGEAQAAVRQAKESEQRFRDLTELLPQPVYEFDTSGRITFANRFAFEAFGYSPAELDAKLSVSQMIHSDDRERAFRNVMKILDGEKVSGQEYRALRKDGTTFPAVIYADRILHDNKVAGLRGVVADISEQKAAEEIIRQREEQLTSFMQNLPVGIFRTTPGPAGRRIFANPILARMHGFDSFEEFMNCPVADHYADPRERKRISDHLLREGRISNAAIHLRKKDGELFWANLSAIAVPGPDGETAYFDGVLEDITARTRAEEDLRESEDRYRKLVEITPDAILVHQEGKIVYMNPAGLDLIGAADADQVIGKPVLDYIHAGSREMVRTNIEKDLNGEGTPSVELQMLRPDGRTVTVEGRGVKTLYEGKPAIQVALRDITQRRQAEQDLLEANRKLNLLSEITRHDILNKVSILLGNLALAKTKTEDPVMAAYIGNLESATHAIRKHIEFTRIYQELGTSRPVWHDPGLLISRLAVPPPVTLRQDLKAVSVSADPILEKVFDNLLDNSLRHGGKVTAIRVSSRKSPDGLTIFWEDDGIGIPAEKKERIFDRGYGRNSGMGLFLCREILAITGITIRETGVSGGGARFELVVPNGMYRLSGSP